MKLLVTGGSGFIGSNFIQYWLDTYVDDTIINVDKLTYAGNPANLTRIEGSSRYSFIHADICDGKRMRSAMKSVDVVVHFAAESHVDRSILNPDACIKTNVLGTQTLLECAVENNVSLFHHVSTDEVFGALSLTDKTKFSEDTPYNPQSPYSASKAASDHLVRAYYHTYGLPVSISNCSNNFGPYQFPEKLIPLVITNLLEGKKVPVYGDGLYIRDWLFVLDHCRGIDCIIHKGIKGQTYCMGGMTEDISNIEVVRKILSIMGKSETEMVYVKDRPGHDRRYAVNWTKINKELGWKPEHNFDEYLIRTVQWYTDHVTWWQNVKNSQYKTYYKTQYGGDI